MNNNVGVRTVLGFVILALLLVVSCSGRKERTVYFFYEAVCPDCEETQRMQNLAYRVVSWGREQKGITVSSYDVFHADASEAFDKLRTEYEVDISLLTLPVLFADGKLHEGFDEIDEYLLSHPR